VLVLQKAYTVTRASVTPRLLPEEITLVTANSRCALATLFASTIGVPVAAGVDEIFGGGTGGAAWVLRIGTLVYLVAMVPGLRLPDGVDEPFEEPVPAAAARAGAPASGLPPHDTVNGGQPGFYGGTAPYTAGYPPGQASQGGRNGQAAGGQGADRSADRQAGRRRRWRLFPRPVGPIVSEAIAANLTLRAYSGFMIFFLAFLLRTVHFGHISDKIALLAMAVGVAMGGFVGTAIGALIRSRAPQLMLFLMLAVAAIVTALCAVYFGLWAAVIVAFSAAIGQTLVKLALDSIVQREISPDVRSSTFAASESLHQLAWVVGGLIGLLLSLTRSGVIGLSFAAACIALSFVSLIAARRNRILRAKRPAPQPL
jgi:hypothetical protein